MKTQIKPEAVDSVQLLKDNLEALRGKFDSISMAHNELSETYDFVSNQLNKLCVRVDSAEAVANNYMVRQDYFSDIISSQLMWFTIIIAVTAIIAGLCVWKGVLQPFKEEVIDIKNEHETIKAELQGSLKSTTKELRNELQKSSYNSNTYINKIRREVRRYVDDEFDEINVSFNAVVEDFEEQENRFKISLENQTSLLKKEQIELLKKQDSEFKSRINKITKGLYQTTFDVARSMCLIAEGAKRYNSALSWAIKTLFEYQSNKIEGHEISTFTSKIDKLVPKFKYYEGCENEFKKAMEVLELTIKKTHDTNVKEELEGIKDKVEERYYLTKTDYNRK
ncbi:hypothetical protein J1N10_06845 [Carboxylicivirga sp. A043]|uniref:hypothetical protein n=1 Tax=Carboxylicivirga litoralis TaxID=2816963 RepID=UPI0021CB4B01|nr:hypothetical protein [Carboxylicivirga sp. A043]MCU4155689.1 hypothetical protein [Carboxylicivirga sp. A043]